MIHEQQSRQLCALHAVNNLLQLPPNLDYDSLKDEEDDNVDQLLRQQNKSQRTITLHEWACREKQLWRYYYEHFSTTCCFCKKEQEVSNTPCDGDTHHDCGSDATMMKTKKKRHWRVATQQEFDDIAHELTLREQSMLTSCSSGEEESNTSWSFLEDVTNSNYSTNKQKLSLLQRICSHHGTPYFGNYSIEVLKVALLHRGVELEFYHVPPDNMSTSVQDNNDDDAQGSTKCLIGFIVHVQNSQASSFASSFLRMGRYIPIVKHVCDDVGRHWYAITRVKYKQRAISSDFESENNSQIGTITDSSWSLIDTKVGDISTFHTDKELHDFIRDAQQHEGCLVFGAYLTQ